MSSTSSCGVVFESDPVWLWSLRANSWSTIFVTASNDMDLRRLHPTLRTLLESKIVVIASTFGGDHPSISPDIMLISGNRPFLESTSANLPPDGVHLFWMAHSPRKCPSDLISASWTRISHCKVGGVTDSRGTFGVSSSCTEISLDPDLRRSLSHILKHSIRPRPCDPDTGEDHYKSSDLLSLSFPRRPVLYPTFMSRSGWGIRSLTDEELGLCFDLPPFVPWDFRYLRDIVPIQLFRSVLDHVTERMDPQSSTPKRILSSAVLDEASDRLPFSNDTWLSSIGRWLPGSWSDAVIASKAVKSDDAPIDYKPWRRRIQLVFPCPDTTISVLERFATHRWRRNVCRSFFDYIRYMYGDFWTKIGNFCKRPVVSDPLSLSSKRRKRFSRDESSGSTRGVVLGEVGGAHVEVVNAGRSVDFSSLRTDLSSGLRVIGQVLRSTWWEWTHGSSPLFWRWNGADQIKAARDGLHIFCQTALSKSRRPIPRPRFDIDTRKIVSAKITSIIQKSYLEFGPVNSRLHYFAVPKGDSDVRIVFDGTSCGLNEALWSPNFFLPTSRNASELLSFDSWMADADFSEFFHNFFCDEKIRCYSGVDTSCLSPFLTANPRSPLMKSNQKHTEGLRWNRLFMGMKPSPYNAVRSYYWAEEFAKGDLRDSSNPFGFDSFSLNLPGMESYDTLKSKSLKWNSSLKMNAGDVVTFVDDVRIVGSSKEHCRSVHRQFTSRVQYLGIQDAPRKYRPPSQDQAGAWTGTIFKINRNSITKSVSLEKWNKGKDIIDRLHELIIDHPFERPVLNRKQLEKHTGFLNHLTMTFDDFTPFLKGFYLTLNSWRPKRDSHDWKMTDKSWMRCLVAQLENGSITETEFQDVVNGQTEVDSPTTVTASPRFSDDVRSLVSMFSHPIPPEVNLRSTEVISVIYGFGDASGTGLGATFTCGTGFNYRIGEWGSDDADQSSNWREFTNIVESLEEEAVMGNLSKSKVFMFTDNSTVESCAIKGSSSSPKLLELVIRLRSLSTRYGIRIHIFHVAGTRMIAQGTDGVSRGFLGEGIMSGSPMETFIPIHLSAIDRSPTVVTWVESWVTTSPLMVLSPRDWFDVGHDVGGWERTWDQFSRPHIHEGRVYLWSPPPFAADIAISELRKARIKRQGSSHIFIVPRLCSPLWMKQVYKAADIVFELPVGHPVWPRDLHEPLLIAIVFPFIRNKPWQLRGTPKMYEMASKLRRLFQAEDMDARDLLRQFWDQCHRLRTMPENVVRQMLYFRKRS